MKKILIALNFGSAAETIAKTGFEIASAMNAELLLVHVVNDRFEYDLPLDIVGLENVSTVLKYKNINEIKVQASCFLAAIAAQLGGTNIRILVTEGETVETIVATGISEKADLIVIGSHRFAGAKRRSHSYTASVILNRSKIPLLTVPIGG